MQDKLLLGNLTQATGGMPGIMSGHVADLAEAPEDFVIATGMNRTVREFAESALQRRLPVCWTGSGMDEKVFIKTGKIIVGVDPRYFRPTEVETLLGDPAKAARLLGWKPRVKFEELVSEMVRADLEYFRRELLCKEAGYNIWQPIEDRS